jgi:hypothetical protein
VKYLVQPSKLGSIGAALLAQLNEIRGMVEPPKLPVAQAPAHDRPSPSKLFSSRGKRRLGLVAMQRKAARKAQKAARRKNRRGK